MHQDIQERVQRWLDEPYAEEIKEEIRRLRKEAPDQLIDAFYRDLSFGTGGMRGIMGIGTNRINVYTIRRATQGLANYWLKLAGERRVFVGYDVRKDSRLFAEETAKVFSGNGFEVWVTKEVCPTPLVSFGCRQLECMGAVMITASHNPPKYNGYKVYGSDGAQVVAPHDCGIMEEVANVRSLEEIRIGSQICWMESEIDEEYLKRLNELRRLEGKKSVRVVYSNLHGTGLRMAPRALKGWGFEVQTVKKQASLDGSFACAASPNPEEAGALAMGSEQMLKEGADLLLANDPDADRIGAAVRVGATARRLSGHEMAVLGLAHVLESQPIPQNGAVVKTIVTTELFRKIAESIGVQCFDVLTGFKYIAELIREWEQSFGGYQFLFGAEESHGILQGTFVRDKDGIGACCLLAEAAEEAKRRGKTLVDRLHELYRQHGVHRQRLETIAFSDSPQGMRQMTELMAKLRKQPPEEIAGAPIVRIDDYLSRVSMDVKENKKQSLALAVSDVLHFWLSNQSTLVIRPSGTEPKIKIYLECSEEPSDQLEDSMARCDQQLGELIDGFKTLL